LVNVATTKGEYSYRGDNASYAVRSAISATARLLLSHTSECKFDILLLVTVVTAIKGAKKLKYV